VLAEVVATTPARLKCDNWQARNAEHFVGGTRNRAACVYSLNGISSQVRPRRLDGLLCHRWLAMSSGTSCLYQPITGGQRPEPFRRI
jgi:hypothetical protein